MVDAPPVDDRSVDRRARRHQRTRSDILRAAWQLAERDGIAAISLRDLAREVGMRAPSLYTYFDSKGAIYDAMFAQGYQQLEHELSELQVGTDGVPDRDRFVEGLQRWLKFCQASLPRYQLLFTRVIPDWAPSADAYAASLRVYQRMASAYGAAGITDPAALDLWTAVSSGLAAQQLANDPLGDRWTRLAPAAVDMFLEHVRGEMR